MAFVPPLLAAVGPMLASTGGMAALAGGAAALGAVTSIQNANYQAAVARNNAAIEEQNAARLSEAAQQEQVRSDQSFAALMAEQLAAQGASGFDILGDSQTASRMLTSRVRGQQATDIRREGEQGTQEALQNAANFRGEARQAKVQGYLNAAGQVLGAASSMASSGTFVPRRRRMPWTGRPNWYGG